MTANTTRAPASADLADLVATLRHHHAAGRTRSYEWRIRQLDGIARFCEEREDDIASALGADLGRPPFDAWFGDIASTMGEVNFAKRHLKRWMRPQRQRVPLTQLPGSARVQYEPLGVVLVIGPWNYPIYLSLSPLVAAVAAGNCVVLKPSELAPATSRLLADALPHYLDPDAVRVVEGDGIVTQDLLSLGFDHAFFTGGTEIGRKIMTGAAATLTPVTLELGGKSPVIVTEDADLAVAARRIAWVKTMNSGQTCIAPDYVLVHESVRDELVVHLKTAITDIVADRPEGLRIVNDRQFARLSGYLAATKADVVLGGVSDADALRMQPTILVDPDPDEPAMTEEIFGPILPVVSYDSIDNAIAFVNGRPKPLAMYVFSSTRAVTDRLVDAIPAGGAVVNHVALHCLVPTLPFGGVGASGMGAYHGEWGFQALSHRKAVLVKTIRPDLKIVYPPYSDRAKALMRKLF
ncbi:aldehyde dehydrogenase family protein [Nocardioides immobilis]|uniref:Aldehyde dehydrogenase n=1 Tax=Nocardioides immobilis TaxID=2049295 RepID=A0A417XZA4_9ACTN|nr:aldehyde dehydrogenase family protein [Nocardioides immobilis]RHW25691.1 aldehyde dehydrogenase family protein [Nocardioides immobilis]